MKFVKNTIFPKTSLNQRRKRAFDEFFRTRSIPESLEQNKKAEIYGMLEHFIRPSLFRYRKIADFNIDALKGAIYLWQSQV